MKTTILKMAFIGCLTTASLTSCNNSTENKAENLEEAKADVAEADKELNQARLDSAREYTIYKKEVEAKLVENDLKITELKEKMNLERKETRAKYEIELKELEAKNTKLKSGINDYKQDTKEKWESFKQEFNQQMDDLGKAISAMAEKNIKKSQLEVKSN